MNKAMNGNERVNRADACREKKTHRNSSRSLLHTGRASNLRVGDLLSCCFGLRVGGCCLFLAVVRSKDIRLRDCTISPRRKGSGRALDVPSQRARVNPFRNTTCLTPRSCLGSCPLIRHKPIDTTISEPTMPRTHPSLQHPQDFTRPLPSKGASLAGRVQVGGGGRL